MRYFFLSIVIFLTVASGIGVDILARTFAFNRKSIFAVSAAILYAISGIFWIVWLQYSRLSIAVTLWVAFGEILAILVGVFYFHEKLTAVEIALTAVILGAALTLNILSAGA